MSYLLKTKKKLKNFKKQDVQAIFTKMILIRLVFNTIWLMEIFKNIARRTASEKFLKDKAFNIAKNLEYNGYQRGLSSMVYKFFDKKLKGRGIANNDIKQNLDLTEELHKLIIIKFKKSKDYSGFRDNIWGADLADMQLISKILIVRY